jgi:hypothetical protein
MHWLEKTRKILGLGNHKRIFKEELEFRRVLHVLDKNGKKIATYEVRVDFNWLTPKRMVAELENFWNFVIVVGGDLTLSVKQELDSSLLLESNLKRQIEESASMYEGQQLRKQADAIAEYISVLRDLQRQTHKLFGGQNAD